MGGIHPPRFNTSEINSIKAALRDKPDPACVSALRKLEARKCYSRKKPAG